MAARPETSSRPADPGFTLLAAALAAAVFLVSWGLLHRAFWGEEHLVDTPVYQKYGDWIVEGRVPYRDFRPEYPPAALPTFVVPSLIVGTDASLASYTRAFEWSMAVCGAAAIALMAVALSALGAGARRTVAGLGFTALAPLALGSVLLSRYDLWPAALSVAAVAVFAARRERLAAGLLGVGVAAKLYPGVLAPLLVAWAWRRSGRREAAIAAGLVVGVAVAWFLPFALVAPDGVAASLGRQLSRPLQIESLGAAALVVSHHVFGTGVAMESSHGSQNIAGTPGVVVGLVATVAQALALLWLWTRFARGAMNRERFVRYAAAAVVAFVALGKVLSPQFMMWLLPLVPLVAGRRGVTASALLAVALVLTQIWFPYRYWEYAMEFDETVSWLVLARDVVLAALLGMLLLHERRDARELLADERREAAPASLVER